MKAGVFRILGSRVQGVGYRPFLLQKYEDYNLSGKARNLPNGRAIEVRVWGKEKDIKEFHKEVAKKKAKPKFAEPDKVTPLRFISNARPEDYEILKHGNAAMAGQFSKAVDVQIEHRNITKQMQKDTTEMRKEMRSGFGLLAGKLDGLAGKFDKMVHIMQCR